MSVRLSLLAILDQGPCYGYQLRSEYERRTGAGPLNVGQIYTTLERLERDGMVTREAVDDRGHVYWAITTTGRSEVAGWLAAPDPGVSPSALAQKVALAVTLPGVDVGAVLAVHRQAVAMRVAMLEASPPATAVHEIIQRQSALAHARADLAWLDMTSSEIAVDASSGAFAVSAERPRRGRPARASRGAPPPDADPGPASS